jgi:hypothetical protein
MAYTQNPGRGNNPKTGHGIPTPFMQTNPSTGQSLKEKASEKAEKLRSSDTSQLGVGETKSFTGKARNITPAKTPEEVVVWKEAIKKPGAGRNIETETATVTKYGQSNLKPAGVTSTSNKITGSTMTPGPKKFDKNQATGTSYTKETTASNFQGFGGGTISGQSPTGSSEIKAGYQKDYTDKYQGSNMSERARTNSSKNNYQSQPQTAQEKMLQGRNLLSADYNPIGVDPNKLKSYLGNKQAVAEKQDVTMASRKGTKEANLATAQKTKETSISAKLASRKSSPAKQMKKKKC